MIDFLGVLCMHTNVKKRCQPRVKQLLYFRYCMRKQDSNTGLFNYF